MTVDSEVQIPGKAFLLLTTQAEFDPHAYTSGRWLHRDELERNSRYVKFDFSALQYRAISVCPGATKVVKCEKREGGFNRVFVFTMDNGSGVVTRVPTGIAGPRRLTTNSEVATMTYRMINQPTRLLDAVANMLYSSIQDPPTNTQDFGLE